MAPRSLPVTLLHSTAHLTPCNTSPPAPARPPGEAAPPAVPRAFVWQDAASNSSVLGMWHPRGYGGILPADCVYAEGLDAVLALDFRGDNAGPPDEAEVRSHWAQLQASFPNATVKAGTWDDFVDRLESVRDTLPVVTQESACGVGLGVEAAGTATVLACPIQFTCLFPGADMLTSRGST